MVLNMMNSFLAVIMIILQLDLHTHQIVVTVVTDERPAAVARAVSSGVGAGVAHKVAISFGEERRSEDTCWGHAER